MLQNDMTKPTVRAQQSLMVSVCRFLRARKWDFEAAKEMLFEAEAWRRQNKVDELYENFSFPEKEAVNELYPQFYHMTDKDGRPVYIEQLGNLDLNKLFKVTTPERLIQQLIYEYEKCLNERMPVCSELHHKLVETSCTIMDLKNVGIGQFWKVSTYVQQASRIGQYYYPETMGRFYIINSPYIFTTVWAVIKNWLDPVTRDKIQILGSNYIGELAKQIPLEQIPSIVGGKCQCPGGCLMSDAGPWNTPEGKEIVRRYQTEKRRLKSEYYGTKEEPQPCSPDKPTSHALGTETPQAQVLQDASAEQNMMLSSPAILSRSKAVDEPTDEKMQQQQPSSSPVIADTTSYPQAKTLDASQSFEVHPSVITGMDSVSSAALTESVSEQASGNTGGIPSPAPSLSVQGTDGLAPPITSNALAPPKQ